MANTTDRVRGFVVLVSESIANECRESRHATFMVDITTETRPFSVATLLVPESPGNFCRRGGRFGPHSSSESFAPIFYRKLVFLAYFNGGVRAMDITGPTRGSASCGSPARWRGSPPAADGALRRARGPC